MRPLLVASFIAVVTAAAALATPSDDVVNAFTKMGSASSYHMAIESAQGQMDIDMVPPDKMHMLVSGGKMEMIRIAGSTYVKVNGNWMKLPMAMPQMDQQMGAVSYVQAVGSHPRQTQVDDLGSKSVDGATYHAFRLTPEKGEPATLYVDGSGYPARVDVTEGKSTSIVRFSKFNAPLTISAPI